MGTGSPLPRDLAFERITQILACKWSLHIFDCIESGATRPSTMEREVKGLANRVLHRCLKRLVADGLLERKVFPEIPPHVEYELTDQGRMFLKIVREARGLAAGWTGSQPPVTSERRSI